MILIEEFSMNHKENKKRKQEEQIILISIKFLGLIFQFIVSI